MDFTVERMGGTKQALTEEGLRDAVRNGGLLFEVMGREGDVKKIWDPSKQVEVDDAKRSFDDLKAKGYRAYRCNDKGDQGEPMNEFDPKAGRVVLVPPMVGG